MLPKLKYLILSAFLLLASYNLMRTTLEIYKSSQRLEELKGDVADARKQNEELKSQLSYRQSPQFVEEEARNKLNMIKPGEQLVIPISLAADGQSESPIVLGVDTESRSKLRETNVDKWLDLFFDTN